MWSGNEQSIQQVVRDKSSNSSLSEIRSIPDCQANLFSVFLCLPRAKAFTSWSVHSPKVYWRAHTADSYDTYAAFRRPREETRTGIECGYRYQFTKGQAQMHQRAMKTHQAIRITTYLQTSHSSQTLKLCVFDFVLLAPSKHVNIVFPEALWTKPQEALWLTVPDLVTIGLEQWFVGPASLFSVPRNAPWRTWIVSGVRVISPNLPGDWWN